MQKTRQQILDVLNHLGKATVQQIVDELQRLRGDDITPVTVRHHLNLLQRDSLIHCPGMQHSNRPGRPKHVYELTIKAHDHLPTNYQHLTGSLLSRMREHLPPANINVIFEGVAVSMAAEACIPDTSLEDKFDIVVEYLSEHGYDAEWEVSEEGYMLHTSNCPYHDIAQHDETLCNMDMRLIASLVGVVPRRISLVAKGDATCSYLFPLDTLTGSQQDTL